VIKTHPLALCIGGRRGQMLHYLAMLDVLGCYHQTSRQYETHVLDVSDFPAVTVRRNRRPKKSLKDQRHPHPCCSSFLVAHYRS
jgi:hypothetical protein